MVTKLQEDKEKPKAGGSKPSKKPKAKETRTSGSKVDKLTSLEYIA